MIEEIRRLEQESILQRVFQIELCKRLEEQKSESKYEKKSKPPLGKMHE